MLACFEAEPWEQDYLREAINEEMLFFESPITLTHTQQIQDAEGLIVFVYSQVTREILDALPNLKFICTMSTGFDHIDLNACKEKNINVSNVPFYGENTVAEHTLALILTISRNIPQSLQRVKGGSFDAHGLRGFDLKGKTLGVIGTGHIGQHVMHMAKGFQMRIVAYDPFPKWEMQEEIGFAYMDLPELLTQSDIVTLHCPYNEHTHHILNKDNIPTMKDGAIIINTARGSLIDSDALLKALQSGKLGGAGLDVLEEECSIKDEREVLTTEYRQSCDLHAMLIGHVLINLPNVYVTPHNAFNSEEALKRILDTTVENILAIRDGDVQNSVL